MPDQHRLALEQALAEVRAAKAPLDAAEARIVTLIGREESGALTCEHGTQEDHADWPDNAGHTDLISIGAAAARAAVSKDTIRRWCRSDKIGKIYGARWRVSHSRLRSYLAT